MQQFETVVGTRKVISSRNDDASKWQSRMYVNGGETATLVTGKHATEANARKWAEKVLAR